MSAAAATIKIIKPTVASTRTRLALGTTRRRHSLAAPPSPTASSSASPATVSFGYRATSIQP